MFLFLLLSVCGLLLRAEAQGAASLWRGNDGGGRCHYTFSVASPAEASCPGAGGPEVDGLKARLGLLEAAVAQLSGGGGQRGPAAGAQPELQETLERVTGERNLLRGEKERLEKEAEGLRRRMEEMRRETERLRSRPCPPQTPMVPPGPANQDRTSVRPAGGSSQMSHLMTRPNRQGDSSSLGAWQHAAPGFQELKAEVTEVPAPDASQDNTGCGELISVGDPVTHRKTDNIAGKYGVWLQDPEAAPPYGPGMIWRIDTIGTDVRQMFGYDDMEQLSKGFPSKVLLLPDPLESTGATLYRGSLYYQRRLSRSLIRYDLAAEHVAARRELPHAGFHGQFPYSWGGYTDIDLSADEKGLWAVYSTSKAQGNIVISRLDPRSLEVTRSWETSVRKASVANSFMVCGRLYTVASYAAPDTAVNYVYDTETGRGRAVSIPFKNKYGYNSMLDYNLAQRRLFSWDNFHLVSYELRLQAQ
ncbi:unnamed protein product [Menidia menidia]|uniref:Myocilin n=1 Tax=Menidia menidia TaxID=238744 RepID=A0A8S4AKJ9_9TELE|nr:unnamed protein product [Menidia menidia]